MVYERLEKIRGDLQRAKEAREKADQRVKQLEQRLKEAENSQILADVGALKLSPEQLAQVLSMLKSGQLPNGEVPEKSEPISETAYDYDANKDEVDYESEDLEDEE